MGMSCEHFSNSMHVVFDQVRICVLANALCSLFCLSSSISRTADASQLKRSWLRSEESEGSQPESALTVSAPRKQRQRS